MVGIVKNRQEMLDKVRKKMAERGNRRSQDENEFRIPRAQNNEELNFYFRILPELSKDETCSNGVASRDYEFFFYPHGAHWIDRQKIECPRLHDGEKCDICQLGFDLLQETSDEDSRREISRKFLPRTYYTINAYFLDIDKNPEDLRGKVMWMSVPKTIYDIFDACVHSSDPGDDDDPKAFGMFYDCEEGFVFKLVATKKGEWNTYEASRFLASKGPSPLVKTKKGGLDEKRAVTILEQRHDLVTKFDERNPDKIAATVKKLLNDDGDDGGFDEDETAEKEDKPKTSKKSSKGKSSKKTKDEDEVDESPADDEVDESPAEDEAAEDTKEEEEESQDEAVDEEDDEELANLLNTIKGDG
jgi:hypothetical protein